MFCLVTDLMDWDEYPAAGLAALYKWRWDGSETALREVKARLDGAGPSAGPMLRSGSPGLVRQELAAWAAANGMTRGVARYAALAAAPARKGRRAGIPVQPRDLSHGRARRAVTDRDPRRQDQPHGGDQGNRETPHRRRPEPAPRPQVQVRQHLRPRRTRRTSPPGPPPPSSPSRTRPPDKRKYRNPPKDASPPSRGPGRPRHDTPATGMPANRNYPP